MNKPGKTLKKAVKTLRGENIKDEYMIIKNNCNQIIFRNIYKLIKVFFYIKLVIMMKEKNFL